MSNRINSSKKTTKKLHPMAAALIGFSLLLQGGLSFADDTEIFFGKPPSNVRSNIFFVLDDSGSMKYCLDSNNENNCSDNPKGNQKSTRMKVLKDTMLSLLRNMEDMKDANVGLMTFRQPDKDRGGWCAWGVWCPKFEPQPPALSQPLRDINNSNVRDNLVEVIDKELKTGNYTPTSMSLYDAARYLTDLPGKHDAWAIKDHPNSPSPIIEECQPTHLVLLTDGQSNLKPDVSVVESLIGKTCATKDDEGKDYSSEEYCSRELATWMHEQNHSELDGTSITTHTIGFALNALSGADGQKVRTYLQDIAKNGGGVHRTADKADDLLKAFKEILLEATQVKNTSFVNPSASGGDFQSSGNKSETYYSLFEPSAKVHWLGNLKRYGLKDNGGNKPPTVIDKEGADAIDPVSGGFKGSAKSWWSKKADGNDVTAGGAAANLPGPSRKNELNKRKLLVWLGGSPQTGVAQPMQDLTIENRNIKNMDMLGINNDEETRRQLFRYIRGFKKTAAWDGVPRLTLGDPLHSAPVVFSYACEIYDKANKKCMEPYDHENKAQVAVVGTNEGFVHMFDTYTGKELFAFMPEELLGNIKKLKENAGYTTAQTHIYGMDNTVTVWVNDANNNGKIDGGEKVYVYASMRRGGRGIYALDVTDARNFTDKSNPKLKWKIVGGKSSGFEKLGQTWSKPVKTKVKIGGETKDVLIFGGGYDERQDTDSNYRTQDVMGNDIYMVDAVSGEKLWSASSLNLDRMRYSIPATVRVLTDNDGLATQFFVGDTGGQVWRFFIKNGAAQNNLVTAGGKDGIFFDAAADAPSGHTENSRRFYHEADVALDSGGLIVNIGSGYRAHPLDTVVKDRMYSIHTTLDNSEITLTEMDLVNVNAYFNGEKISAEIAKGSKGWLIELQEAGEKIISTPLTERGRVIFNSYVPNTSTVKCAPAIGKNKIYDLHLLDATPASMKLGEAFSYSEGSFFTVSKGQGISGSPGLICLADRCWVQYSSGEFSDPFSTQVAGRKTYWIDLQ